jgi:hypothetical protein
LDREDAEALSPREKRTSVVRSKLLDIAVKRMREGGANNTSDSLTAATHTKTQMPTPFPQIDPHPNSPKPSSTPNSPHTLTHSATTMSASEYSKYSGGVEPSPPQQVLGASKHSSPTSYSQPHYDGTSDVLAAPTFLDGEEARTVLKPLPPPPPQEDRGPTSDMEADGYYTRLDSGATASQDSESHEGKLKSSSAPPRQGLATLQAQQDGLVESSSLGPVDTAMTSVSENGMHSTPPLSSYVGC